MRNSTFCLHTTEEDWHAVKDLYQQASSTEKQLGFYQLAKANRIKCEMVIFKNKNKGRKDLVAVGDRSRKSKRSLSNAAREREPWLLATSLASRKSNFAKRVVKIYRSRMQIEESFRDLKTGLNFSESNTRKKSRIEVLLLISIIAQYVLFLLGMTVKLLDKHRRYQANSIKDRNVLSYQFIGLRAFKDKNLKLNEDDFIAGFDRIQILITDISVV